MNEHMTRHVYLAIPCDDANGEVATLRTTLRQALREAQVNFFDPSSGFCTPQPKATSHFEINQLAIRTAWGVLAVLKAGVCSVGVPQEIMDALDLHIPMVVVTDVESRQLAALGVPTFGFAEYHDAVGLLIHLVKTWEYRATREELLVTGTGRTPNRARRTDAGLDLYVAEGATIPRGGRALIPCEVAVQLPPDTWGFIVGRSSAMWGADARSGKFGARRLFVTPGVIDEEFRGPLFVGVVNVGDTLARVEPGERLAQIIVMPNRTAEVTVRRVEKLDRSSRGENGFGSSGA